MPEFTFLNRCKAKPLIVALLGLCSCGSGLHSLPIGNLDSSVRMLYSIDALGHRILRYTPNELGTATLDSWISLPSDINATQLTTDAIGNLYVGGYTTSKDRSKVLVYAVNAADHDAPMRTLKLRPGKLTALAVDRQNTIYVAEKSAVESGPQAAIYIYSAGSKGATPTQTIYQPSAVELNDLAVDSAGHVYVSGSTGSDSFIREFSATASDTATATRTVWAPHGTAYGGLAVDDDGNIFVMQGATICKLAAGTSGTPQAAQTINLPAKFISYTTETFSNVLRRDGIGDFFVPTTMTGANGSVNMVYGFASNAAGDATPVIQFTVPDATATAPNGESMPLAVF